MTEITFQEIKDKFDVCFGFWGKAPIFHDEDDTYWIRIKTFVSFNWNISCSKVRFDFFVTDNKGIIRKSPRGYAKEYNNKVKITDIVEQFNMYDRLRKNK